MAIQKGMEDDTPIPIITDVVAIPLEDKTTSRFATTTPTNITIPSGSAVVSNPNSTVATENITTTAASGSRIQLHNNLGRNSTGLQCQHCGRETVTFVKDMVGVTTAVAVIVLAVLFWPLLWVPFCVPSCKETSHYCGHVGCRKKVGVT
ncbi:hypothetical protein FRACYDRAFT_237836 [Fragilariopsis cylindrus CCMP1102]|uniref:LITAF domain-containing protein n=1 Tax=Fragilariopsis cylindrus CCMP1102 TaxID=635003 RepID=A0A1E7FGV6_9STRA|nr:hypothetical protein FRACYDRAFT_237836 [Fragilariopsis cylindrus CCMP1102]|eukprot:OEU17418.1 hypothetical protein FRACYDRAFT_237836 [Fragilariopsis cylindrus CCMP1102]